MNEPQTPLQTAVHNWAESQAEDDDYTAQSAVEELLQYGCQSGIVSELIYYTDTVKFYNQHQREIDGMLAEMVSDMGSNPSEMFGDKWDDSDPLARDEMNQNLLAWFGFEEAARQLNPDW